MAVGTFFGQGLKGAKWAVGTWNKWLLGHLMVRKFAIRGQMAVGTLDKWLLAHFAVRGIAIRGQMAVGTFLKAFLTISRGFRAF